MKQVRFNIGQAAISDTNLKNTLSVIDDTLRSRKTGYVCVTNSRAAYLINIDKEYKKIQNESLLSVPDGMPLIWIAHNQGYNEVGKVSGKDLMDAIFDVSVERLYTHYFFGSSPETIIKLREQIEGKYPGIQILGAVSPAFQPLEKFDINILANEINQLKPSFFWCGLGAPKQERLIYLLHSKLNSTICVGVGLAFEYFAGTVKRAPPWMVKSGLEWVYRLAQQPWNIGRAIRPLSWIFLQLVKSNFKQ